MSNSFIDVHCHLYLFKEVKRILDEAEEVGVKYVITNSEDLKSCKRNAELLADERVYGAFGIHPQHASKEDPSIIKEFLDLEKAVAVGEIGLDYKFARNNISKRIQKEIFEKQIIIAEKRHLPIIVHSRYAHKPVIEVLERLRARKVVLHWFSGSIDLVIRAVKNGWFLSFGPFSLNQAYEKVIEIVPLESMLLETDSPVPFRGKPVDPSWIPLVAGRIARIKGIGVEEVAKITTDNAKRLFNLLID